MNGENPARGMPLQHNDILTRYVANVGHVSEKVRRLERAHAENLREARRLANALRSLAAMTPSRAVA